MSEYDDILSEALNDLRQARHGLETAQTQMQDARATVRSRDRSLSATVGPQGQLHHLTFHGDRYKSMPAPELAALLMSTIEQARTECLEQVTRTVAEAFGGELGQFDPAGAPSEGFDEFFSRAILDQLPDLSESEARDFERSWKQQP